MAAKTRRGRRPDPDYLLDDEGTPEAAAANLGTSFDHEASPPSMAAEDVLRDFSGGDEPGEKTSKKKTAAKKTPGGKKGPANEKVEKTEKKDPVVKVKDAYLEGCIQNFRKEFRSTDAYIGAQLHSLMIGIQVPLPLQWLLKLTALPLGGVMHIVGLPGVGKTGLLGELFRLNHRAGGYNFYGENESKVAPIWLESIMTPAAFRQLVAIQTADVEEWEKELNRFIATHIKFLEGTAKKPGPGKRIPTFMGIDGVTSKLTAGSQAKVAKEGSTGRAHPVEAGSITHILKQIPGDISEWPFLLILVNHLKLSKDERGHEVRNIPGGAQIRFQTFCELDLRRYQQRIATAGGDIYTLYIKTSKSSFGRDQDQLVARIVARDVLDEVTYESRQETVWDWEWSTVNLLANLLRGADCPSPQVRANLKKVDFHLETPKTSAVENTAWSKTLGVTEGDPISWHEMGKLIHADQDLMTRIQGALGIKKINLLEGDYGEQREEIKRRMG